MRKIIDDEGGKERGKERKREMGEIGKEKELVRIWTNLSICSVLKIYVAATAYITYIK